MGGSQPYCHSIAKGTGQASRFSISLPPSDFVAYFQNSDVLARAEDAAMSRHNEDRRQMHNHEHLQHG